MKQLITILTLLITANNFSQTPAFPCAEGAGAYATGGRGGTVLHVTNLLWNNSPGSLKWALEQNYPRTIVFDVSGTIDATNGTRFYELRGSQYSDLTIAGQTAPEGGITIEHNYFKLYELDNVIIRYVRFVHKGYFDPQGPINATAFSFGIGEYGILDHVSARYSWNSFAIGVRSDNKGQLGTTVQRCLLGDSKTGLGQGENPNIEINMVNAADHTAHHNLFAHISHRFPSMSGNSKYEVINNVAYNPRERLALSFGTPNVNLIGNYYRSGSQPLLGVNKIGTYVGLWETNIKPRAQWYTDGNIIEGTSYTKTNTDWSYDSTQTYPKGNIMVQWGPTSGETHELADPALFRSLTKFPDIGIPVTTQDVDSAYLNVMADVGANKFLNADGTYGSFLDSVDQGYIDQTIARTGVYRNTTDTNDVFYPILPNNTRPSNFYVSNSHIPEVWFLANVPTGQDHNDTTVNGYTWLEEYINQVDNACGVTPGINNCTGKNAPVATLSSSVAGTYNQTDTVHFGVSYTSDTTVNMVTYYVNGVVLASVTTPFTTNSSGLSPGTYTTYGLITDVCGRTSYTDTVSFTIVNSCAGKNAPIATLSSPLTGSYSKSDTVSFGVNYTSDTALATVDYYLNGTLLANTSSPFTFNTSGIAQGNYTVYAVLTDVCGKTSNSDTVNITISHLEVNACNTLIAPVIDGLADAIWDSVPFVKMGVTEIGLPYPDTNSLMASYKVMWDATSVYFLVKVKDDTIVSDSSPLNFVRDDALTIHIDAQDNNSTTYDADDYYFGIRPANPTINANGVVYTGGAIAQTGVITTDGYTIEVKIDWAYLGLVPNTTNPIGLDFRVDDDDDGGSREHHLLWNDETSTLWGDPSKFGILYLTNTTCQNTTSIELEYKDELSIYPNPTNGELTVTSNNEITKIEVYNSLGSLVYSKDEVSTKTQELNITNLPKGIYSIKVFEANRTIEKQIIKQ